MGHRALCCGAYDFYQKPVNPKELKIVIRRAFQLSCLEEEQRRLQQVLERRGLGLEGMVGQCAAMQRIFSAVQMVAASDVPVLITGESGTGKELVARTIRSLSGRAAGPFVPINCEAVPKSLLDCELFGLEQGTGDSAPAPIPGKIEYACNGTLFIEEPAALPRQQQLKLLRLMQSNKLQRVGASEEIDSDARVICASSSELVRSMQAGELLENLYYRISVITLELPPLRARGADIMLLAHLFLRRYAEACAGKARGFSPEAVRALESHSWPGNVRELESRVQRGVIMSDGPLLEPGGLGFCESRPEREDVAVTRSLTLKEARDQVERKVLSAAVAQNRGNLAKAADLLDVSRSTLYDLLKKHGLFNPPPRH